jgi:hypothetical protein
MLQIARPQSAITPIALTRGLKEMCSEKNGNVKVHSRTGNFSCASEEYIQENQVRTLARLRINQPSPS